MKVSLNWVKEFTDVKLGVDELVEKIGAQLGAVDEVKQLGDKYKGVLVAKVISCEQHPNADKLSICVIDDGGKAQKVERDSAGYVQVVCGAPNVQSGQTVAWIPPGVTVPSTFEKNPFVMESREIRGFASNGMIASPHELDISDDHAGILEIDVPASAGSNFDAVYQLDDIVIDIENKMFTHRPDCFGILGVAREIAGISGQSFKSPDWYQSPKQVPFSPNTDAPQIKIDNKISDKVPRFMAVSIAGVEIKPSPISTQSKLMKMGIRPINNVVDVTNLVMVLTGQPLHAYDSDKLPSPSLETRLSKSGEKVKILGGKEIELKDDATILITSGDKPVGLGGVMGGADTEVDDGTKNIVLECANFDMYTIRRTAMQYGLFTDAVTRFTKGQSPLQNPQILAYAIKNILETAGGTQASEIMDGASKLPKESVVKVTTSFINERLGEQISAADMAKLLTNVEFTVEVKNEELMVIAPFWRTDIEIPEDIVEEVGRLYGYDHLPIELPKRTINASKTDALLDTKTQVRAVLSKFGASEALTYTFIHSSLMEKVGQNPEHAFQVVNALSPDLQYYRLSLIPSLLEKVHANIKQGYDEFALFEINPVHAKGFVDEDKLPVEDQRVAFVLAVDDKLAKQQNAGAPYFAAKRYLIELLDEFGINVIFESTENYEPKAGFGQAAIAPFEKKRSALVKTKDGDFIAEIGEFRTQVRKNLKLPQFIAGFELDVKQLQKLSTRHLSSYLPLPRFPKVRQDISLKVPNEVSFQTISDFIWDEVIKQRPDNCVQSLEPLDIFQKEDDKTHKQLAFHLTIASYDRTLTAEEVNRLLDKVAAAAKTKFGAERL